jgi:hypothetical protein
MIIAVSEIPWPNFLPQKGAYNKRKTRAGLYSFFAPLLLFAATVLFYPL